MPQRRQHISLTNLCASNLGTNVAQCCYEQAAYNTTAASSYVDNIWKTCLSGSVPNKLRVTFCHSFFKALHIIMESLSNDTLMSFKKVALEMIMNLEIAEFIDEISSRILLAVLNPHDARRLRGLRILDLSDVPDHVRINLNRFDLSAVIVFIYPKLCTMEHLKVIGKKASNLEVLNVANSPDVTNSGLQALSQCSKLRYVNVSDCSRVTREGINRFLEANKNVIEFHGWINSPDGLTIFTDPDRKVYSNIERFVLRNSILPDRFARRIVKMFPNLNSLGLFECQTGTLRLLKKMLEFWIGEPTTSLKMPLSGRRDMDLAQNDLSKILAICPNIKNLTFAYKPVELKETLTVPSSPKLQTLRCYLPKCYRHRTIKVKLAKMPELTQFSFTGFKNTRKEIEEIITNEIDLPKLKVMDMNFDNPGRLNYFRRFAEKRNIDLTINDFYARRTTDYSFNFGAANLDGSP